MTSTPHVSKLHDAALTLADLGYAVFPCASGTKQPITTHGCNDASSDIDTIDRWWQQSPSANVAVSTNGFFVLDIDVGSSWLLEDPERSLDLAVAPLSLTARGGRQYFFRRPDGVAWKNWNSELAKFVDIKVDGGYVVVPPATDPNVSDHQLTQMLKSWIVTRKSEANRDRTVAGGKYPHLCRFVNHLHAGLGDSLRIISVERDIEASIRSLQNRSEKHPGQWFAANDEDCEVLQRSLRDHRDNFIAEHPDVPVFRIDFAELVTYPEQVIGSLVEFLGIDPTPDEIQSAIEHVNPDLRKFG